LRMRMPPRFKGSPGFSWSILKGQGRGEFK
jgi:hypothetical protein